MWTLKRQNSWTTGLGFSIQNLDVKIAQINKFSEHNEFV